MKLTHKFTKNIPEVLEDGVIYISMEYCMAIHNCCCGCGTQVPTPISPNEWKLLFDGETITLDPSIGNWSLPCKSHYLIINSTVHWAAKWDKRRVELARKIELEDTKRFYKKKNKKSLFDKLFKKNS